MVAIDSGTVVSNLVGIARRALITDAVQEQIGTIYTDRLHWSTRTYFRPLNIT